MSEPESAAPLAIVGIGCRYPGARGAEELWRLVREERFSVRKVPAHRVALGYDLDRYYDERARIPGRISSTKAGFLDHPEAFDPRPFGLNPRDAAALEPQARMALEVVWDAIEDAGIPFEALRAERVALVLGHTAEDFSRERIAVLGEDAAMRGLDVRAAVGFSKAAISGRISHLLDLRGPSLTIDTACSSSLYAVHLACQSLWLGESRFALAGGLNLFLTPEGSLALSRSGMMAADGKCKAFDERADGFVRAEGAGVVLLRRLDEAIEDGDRIHAVIRGSGVSADGRDGGHMMAPGREGQAQAMHDAYRMAGIDPAHIDFVETHGTGTVVGDPVEIAALAAVMAPGRDPARPLRVSSIKGNIGHAESASGAAGLIKAALAVRDRVMPAQLHFETPSTRIAWDEIPVEVQTKTEPWPHEGVARAGVNSFGISGTNAHIILEAPPAVEPRTATRPRTPTVVALSAHDPGALRELAALHIERLASKGPDRAFGDLAFTLARRRSHHPERVAFVVDSAASLRAELEGFLAGNAGADRASGRATPGATPPLYFVFPGQGGQWAGMAQDLIAASPQFARSIDEWTDRLGVHVGWSLRDVLLGRHPGKGFDDLSILQPTLVALQIAIADWFAGHGVVPDAVLGQSVGEVAAAAVAGALSRDDTAKLACARGAAVQLVAGKGAMGIVGLPEGQTREALTGFEGALEVAGQNGLSSTLIAGNRAPLCEVIARLEQQGVFARVLEVDFASHCFHMDPVLGEFREQIGEIQPKETATKIISSVSGQRVEESELGADHWVSNLRQPVRFADALGGVLEQEEPRFLELSPHPVLGHAIAEVAADCGRRAVAAATLRRGQPGERCLLRALAAGFVHGHGIDFETLHPRGRVLSLPAYPYQKQTLWFGSRRREHRPRAPHIWLDPAQEDADASGTRVFDSILDADTTANIAWAERDPTLPIASGIAIELALAATRASGGAIALRQIRLPRRAVAPTGVQDEEERWELRTTVRRSGDVSIVGRRSASAVGRWECVLEACTADMVSDAATTPREKPADSIEALRDRLRGFELQHAQRMLAEAGASAPAKLEGARDLWLGADELLLRMTLPSRCQNELGHCALPPGYLESAVAFAGVLLEPIDGGPFVAGIDGLRVEAMPGDEVFCHARLDREARTLDLTWLDAGGTILARAEGVSTRPHPHRTCQSGRLRVDAVEDLGGRETMGAHRVFSRPGAERQRFVVQRERLAPTPADGQVSVRVCAAGFAPSECCTLPASGEGSRALGLEFSGVVEETGAGTQRFVPGDRVMGLARGSLASHIAVPVTQLVAIPAGCDENAAAALPLALASAYRAVRELASLRHGDQVLVRSDELPIALAVIRFAHSIGARVSAVAANAASTNALRAAGAEAAFEETAWREGEANRGAFDCVFAIGEWKHPGPALSRLETTARWIAIGSDASCGPPAGLGRHHLFAHVDIETLLDDAPEVVGRWLEHGCVEATAVDAPTFVPIDCVAFPVGELRRALRWSSQLNARAPAVVRMDAPIERADLEVRDPFFDLDTGAVHTVFAAQPDRLEAACHWLIARGARRIGVTGTDAGGDCRSRIEAWASRLGAKVELICVPATSEAHRRAASITCFLGEDDDTRALAHWLRESDFEPRAPLVLVHERSEDAIGPELQALCEERRGFGGRVARLGIEAGSFEIPARARRLAAALDTLLLEQTGNDGSLEWATVDAGASMPSSEAASARPVDEESLRALLESQIASVLALSDDARRELARDLPLIDLGLDSLLARELASQLAINVGVEIPPRVWAERPSFHRLLEVSSAALFPSEACAK